MSRFNNCLLVVNPSGSSYRRSIKLRASLEKAFADKPLKTLRLTKQELSKPTHLRRELKKLNSDSLLAIIGGDGTVNAVLNELMALGETEPLKTTVLPLWGGNACDLAHMANGRRRNSVRPILRRGQRIKVHAMEYEISQTKSTRIGYAMCYVSFGAVAYTASVLDKSKLIHITKELPAVRLLAEAAVGFFGLARAKRFKTSAIRKNEKLYDLLLINGPRMAKLYRTPARLASPDFVELVIRHKYPLFVTHVTRLTRLWVRSTTVKHRSLTLHEPTWMQYDGEVLQLDANTVVQIKPARRAVYILATK